MFYGICYVVHRYWLNKWSISFNVNVLNVGFSKGEIVELDFDNNCSHQKEVKFSVQTLDDEILKNIDRKNIPLTKQIEVFSPIAKIIEYQCTLKL